MTIAFENDILDPLQLLALKFLFPEVEPRPESIRRHRLSRRETRRKVAAALENSPRWEQEGFFGDPRGVVAGSPGLILLAQSGPLSPDGLG